MEQKQREYSNPEIELESNDMPSTASPSPASSTRPAQNKNIENIQLQQEEKQYYTNKIYIPQPQNKQTIQKLKNIQKQCNILQLINSNSVDKSEIKPSLDFFKTLLLLTQSLSLDKPLISASFQPISTKKHHCNCKKTKCIKLYCECFVNGEECDSDCNCFECANNQLCSVERKKAIDNILIRDTNPVSSKFKNTLNSEKQHHGCNCKKSACQKKYCECYIAGLPCTEYCKCEGCKNSLCNKKIQLNNDQTHQINDNESISQAKRKKNQVIKQKFIEFFNEINQ